MTNAAGFCCFNGEILLVIGKHYNDSLIGIKRQQKLNRAIMGLGFGLPFLDGYIINKEKTEISRNRQAL